MLSFKGQLKNFKSVFGLPVNNAFFLYHRNYTKNWPIVHKYMDRVGIRKLLNEPDKVSKDILDLDDIWIHEGEL